MRLTVVEKDRYELMVENGDFSKENVLLGKDKNHNMIISKNNYIERLKIYNCACAVKMKK